MNACTAICDKCQKPFTMQFVACGAPFPTCPNCGIIPWPTRWKGVSGFCPLGEIVVESGWYDSNYDGVMK